MPAPDYFQPTLGWRVWLVVEDHDELRLASVMYPTLWEPRREEIAYCRPGDPSHARSDNVLSHAGPHLAPHGPLRLRDLRLEGRRARRVVLRRLRPDRRPACLPRHRPCLPVGARDRGRPRLPGLARVPGAPLRSRPQPQRRLGRLARGGRARSDRLRRARRAPRRARRNAA